MTNKEAQIILANLKQYISGGGVVDRSTNEAIDMAIKALEKLEPHWIPVTEKLPKKSGVYTITDSKGDVVRFVFVTGSDSSRKYWYRCAKAWMPLPEPYKEVKK